MFVNRAPNRGGSGGGAGGKPPQCQRCLKFGKWTYECCTDPTARVYVSRPSRTQQLKNPKVRQRFADFTGDAPPDPKAEYEARICLLYTSPSPRDGLLSRMPSSA